LNVFVNLLLRDGVDTTYFDRKMEREQEAIAWVEQACNEKISSLNLALQGILNYLK
jgi:hypothetical protein